MYDASASPPSTTPLDELERLPVTPRSRPFREEAPDGMASSMEAAVVDGTVRRWSVDGQDTMAYPIVPSGDTTKFLPDEDGLAQVSFPSIGFQIVYPQANGKLPSSAILDVYAGLMFMYQNAGFPDDGRVYFSRYQLLHLIGWLSTARDERGKRTVKPSGRHYRQLKRALLYLEGTRFVWDDPDALQFGPDGEQFRGMQGFPILQYARVVEDRTGPRGESPSPPARSMAQFSEPFVKLLGGGERTLRFDFDLFLTLSAGTPRLLFRTLIWMANTGRRSIRLEELFPRVGSTQTQYVPARARQILDKAHHELRTQGVLEFDETGPEYVKVNKEWWVRYEFGDPQCLLSGEDVLIRQAVALGVEEARAREMYVAHRTQFERVLAGVVLGTLVPKSSLPGLIVSYTERAHSVPSPAMGTAARTQLGMGFDSQVVRYLVWAAREREKRLEARNDVRVDKLRIEIEAKPTEGDRARDPWVVDGLVQISLNDLLQIETFEQYLRMHDPADEAGASAA